MKTALDTYISTFEQVSGQRFTHRPNIKRISRLSAARTKARDVAKWRGRWNEAEQKPYRVALLIGRIFSFLRMASMDQSPFFDYQTNTLCLPFEEEPDDTQHAIIYCQLGHALLYDKDKSFGFTMSPLVVDWERISKHVFADGFANFCTYEVLAQEGKTQRETYEKLYTEDVIREANDELFAAVLDNQIYYREFVDPAFNFPGGRPPTSSERKVEWERLSAAGRLEKLVDNYGKILTVSPVCGFGHVNGTLEKFSGRKNAEHATLVKCLLNRVPRDASELLETCALYYDEP